MQSQRLAKKHLVLLGVGHTNAHVVRMWQTEPFADTDLTCVSNFSVATYSGMLPAVLARQIPESAMQIDLVRLCASAQARLILDRVTGIDLDNCEIQFDTRPPIPFDALSVGVGSVPITDGIEISGDSLLKIKPMQTFFSRLTELVQERLGRNPERLRVAIVGGGVAGVEVAFCLPPTLHSIGAKNVEITLINRGEKVPGGSIPSVQRRVTSALVQRGVRTEFGRGVVRVSDEEVHLEDGARIPADIVIWATGADSPELLSRLGLPTDDRGFLLTDQTLRSVSGTPIFAVGDTGSIQGESIAKAGVYAVRQGPVLWENLGRVLRGEPLIQYQPQRTFMRLINLGDDRAVGQWRGLPLHGKWALRLKHRIDNEFMRMFQPMSMEDETVEVMQCHGCGCKLGAGQLESALASSQKASFHPEDAARIGNESQGLLASTDFFASPFADAFLAGRIVALHSASDLIASGARVRQAIANVVLPEGDRASQQRMLRDFTLGATQEFSKMGAQIVGGHTIVGPRFETGFTVIGDLINERIEKRNLRPGDQLFLTRELGSGILLAAHMRNRCPAHAYQDLIETLVKPQHAYAEIAAELGITAGTDVTGFGLAGHLGEMLRASGVSAVLEFGSVPFFVGATELAADGIQSSLAPDNRVFENDMHVPSEIRKSAGYPILFDPQTCGGLLFGIHEDQCDAFLAAVDARDLGPAYRIGQVDALSDSPEIRVVFSLD